MAPRQLPTHTFKGCAGSTGTRADGCACGLKQLGGHLFCTRRACCLMWGTTTPDHLDFLPRKPRRETNWRVLTSTSSSEWSVLTDPLEHPRTPTCGSMAVGATTAVLSSLEQAARNSRSVVRLYVAVKSAPDTGKGPGASLAVGWWRYERRPFARRLHGGPSRSTRFCGVHRPGSSQGNPPGRIKFDDGESITSDL
jgi:hypothetical protein